MKSPETDSTLGLMFICYMGVERSVAIKDVYRSVGKAAEAFFGGTKRLSGMKPDDIKKELGGRFCFLIYDQGSPKQEYVAKDKSIDLLRKCGITYEVIDTQTLSIMAHELDRDLNNFLY